MPKKSISYAIDKKPGVYRLQNFITGKFYIGSTKNLYNRYYRHMQILKESKHENIRIKEDCDKFGWSSFVFGVVEYCEHKECLKREQYYFELWNPEYNVWLNVYTGKGRSYTEEQLKIFTKVNTGPKDIPAFKEKLKKAWVNKKQRLGKDGIFQEMSVKMKGKTHSEESRKKMSLAGKGRKKPEGFGEKIRKSRLGAKLIDGKLIKK